MPLFKHVPYKINALRLKKIKKYIRKILKIRKTGHYGVRGKLQQENQMQGPHIRVLNALYYQDLVEIIENQGSRHAKLPRMS